MTDRTVSRRSARHVRRPLVAGALAGAVLLSACGGDGDTGGTSGEPAVTVAPAPDAVEVQALADITTNQLPDLVVDDLGNDNKVNLRNYGVGDRPTLIWMWAPH